MRRKARFPRPLGEGVDSSGNPQLRSAHEEKPELQASRKRSGVKLAVQGAAADERSATAAGDAAGSWSAVVTAMAAAVACPELQNRSEIRMQLVAPTRGLRVSAQQAI